MNYRNKGFTYYELLIVITIMSLMVGFSTITIVAVNRNNVYRSADSIESTLKAARNNAISKGSNYGYANFYYKDGVLYSYVGEEMDNTFAFSTDTHTWEKVTYSINDLNITYKHGGSQIGYNVPDGALFCISFKQSTGEIVSFDTPYNGSVIKIDDDLTFYIEKANKEASVIVHKYGNFEVK